MMRSILITFVIVLSVPIARAADWPMWRYDAGRTAASDEKLDGDLQLLWTRKIGPRRQAWQDPLNRDLMTYDRVCEPIVMDGRMFVGFNDRDKLVAFNADTGETLWSFYTEGPVRLPPAGWNGRVYFCSDDGFLYCVDAAAGRLHWRIRGGPNPQHAIGNQRLTSAWPARGGPVVYDGTVYFAASIWPFMGTFLYAVDAETGVVQWINDRTGSQFIKQPHSAPSFAGVGPQGALVATDELLLVPGGRSVPAVFNRKDGEFRYFEINAGGKGTGGSFVAADANRFYVHTRLKGTRAFNINDGVKTAFMPNEPVLADGLVYASATEKELDLVRAYGADDKPVWEVLVDGSGDLILAGDHLYAAGKQSIAAIRLPDENQLAHVSWSILIEGQVERLLAANGKLFAATLEGDLLAFGPSDATAQAPAIAGPAIEGPTTIRVSQESSQIVSDLLASADAQGYAFWFGASDGDLLDALAADSPFMQLAIVDQDPSTVDRLRRQLDTADLYGRVTAHVSDARSFRAPKYVANMIFIGRNLTAIADEEILKTLYSSVRPYGGVMHLLASDNRAHVAARIADSELEQAQIEITNYGVLVRRVGALPGSADWTHQYGDVANTIKSNDRRVKVPLGVLWFGGNSNQDILPRHGHGPPEQVVGGRLFIQGMNSLSARDVYTGRALWRREFEDLGTFDVYHDATYTNTPLDPQYNQVHIPGANGRGTNYVVTHDRVYIAESDTCHVLDPATGDTIQDIQLPTDDAGNRWHWGYIGVYEDVLIGGLGFAKYRVRNELTFEEEPELKANRAGYGTKSLNRAASLALVGFDRNSGEQLWTADAVHSFWHNGIVAGGGRIYCLDKNPKRVEDALKRRGKSLPGTYRIVALDYRSGEPRWEVTENIFGTWLGYSAAHDLLLQAGAAASDRLYDEVGAGMAVYAGRNGSVQWKNESIKYAGPCILHNDLIITNANSYKESAGAFHLVDGQQKLVPNPVTGELQPWKISRTYGCNNVIASENLLTFRSGAAGYYDLLNDSGTGNFGGFKSGCTSNLVVANGVLNAPDYTRTCHCAYPNQTSLAMVHMPEMELWTVNTAAAAKSADKLIRNIGINFGAPGDRRDTQGLLWLEYPIVAGTSPPLTIEFNSEARFFRRHPSSMAGHELPWVLASGVKGPTEIRIGLDLPELPKEDQPAKEGTPAKESGAEVASDVSPTAPAPAAPTPAARVSRTPSPHRVRLFFGAPQNTGLRRCVFDVYLQDLLVESNVKIDPTGSVHVTAAIYAFDDVMIADQLRVRFVAKEGTSILSGIELIRTEL
jgi:outer membrane protein assembly factor BamB